MWQELCLSKHPCWSLKCLKIQIFPQKLLPIFKSVEEQKLRKSYDSSTYKKQQKPATTKNKKKSIYKLVNILFFCMSRSFHRFHYWKTYTGRVTWTFSEAYKKAKSHCSLALTQCTLKSDVNLKYERLDGIFPFLIILNTF